MRRERELGAVGSFAEHVVEGFLGGGVAFGLCRGGGSGDVVEGGEKEIAEASVGTVREAPGVAEFLAELAAMVIFGGGIGEGEGTRVLGDGDGIVFVELGEFAELFCGWGIGEKTVAGVGVFASGGVVMELGFETRAEQEE